MIRGPSKLLLAGACALAFSAPILAVSPGAAADHGQYVQYDVQNAMLTDGRAINRHGTITGTWGDFSSSVHGFVRGADGSVSTFDPKGAQVTFPVDINDEGTIVGYYQDPTLALDGFIRKPGGKIIRLGNEGIRVANSINNHGDICGSLADRQAFIRTAAGQVTEIDPPGAASSFATALNDGGTLTGYFKDSSGQHHGFLRAWDGTITTFDPADSVDTLAFGINASGVIVGSYSDAENGFHGYIRDASGNFTDFSLSKDLSIDSVDSLSINNKGVVAGDFRWGPYEEAVAFERRPSGRLIYLTPPGATLNVIANGLNDDGVIVGSFEASQDSEPGYLRLP